MQQFLKFCAIGRGTRKRIQVTASKNARTAHLSEAYRVLNQKRLGKKPEESVSENEDGIIRRCRDKTLFQHVQYKQTNRIPRND